MTNQELTVSQIQDSIKKEIEKIDASMKQDRETIARLRGYGTSWALDCREMQIAESSLSYNYGRLATLQQHLDRLEETIGFVAKYL